MTTSLIQTSWRTATLATLAVITYLILGPVPEALLLDRAVPLGPEPWRLWSAHLTHSDPGHLFWDVTGMVLVGLLYEPLLGRRLWALLAIGGLVIALAVLFLSPEIDRYCGLSGLINLVVGAGLAASWRRGERLLAGFALLVAAKVLIEGLTGAALFTDTAWRAVHEAHQVGFAAGLLLEAVLGAKARTGDTPTTRPAGIWASTAREDFFPPPRSPAEKASPPMSDPGLDHGLYDQLSPLPENLTGEILDGEPHAQPRPTSQTSATTLS